MTYPKVNITCLVICILSCSLGCQKSETAYHELKPEDLVSSEFETPYNSIDDQTQTLTPSPLNIFAPPGVLETLPAKPLATNYPVTQVSAVNTAPSQSITTTEMTPAAKNDILPFDPNARLEEVVLTQSLPLVPKEIKLLIPEKSFAVTSPDNALRITYDDIDLLKILNMDPVPFNAVDYFPEWLKELEGKQVRIRGYMFPTKKNTGITYFSLARDTGICCFGPNGKVYDLFGVKLKPGTTANYMELRPFDVVGTFHIEPDIFNNVLENIYYIDNASIIQ